MRGSPLSGGEDGKARKEEKRAGPSPPPERIRRREGPSASVTGQAAGQLRTQGPVAVEDVQPAGEPVAVDVVLPHDPHRDPVEHLPRREIS